jgi:ABC-type multidrug transport system fused ATPase/permease subunit
MQTLAAVVGGFTISFIYEWRMTLAALGLFPLIVISGVIRTRFKGKISKTMDEVHKHTSGTIS